MATMNSQVPVEKRAYKSVRRSRCPIWCELVCACCSKTTAGRFVWGPLQRNIMKRDAQREGWLFERDEAFCTDDCRLRWLKEKEKAA